MMDLKDIIKWFVPCLNILFLNVKLNRAVLTLFCVFVLIHSSTGSKYAGARTDSVNNSRSDDAKYISVRDGGGDREMVPEIVAQVSESSRNARNLGRPRTFGRPLLKKIMTAIIPLAFQIGAASTWAVVAALVGVKTLLVALLILKLLLVAGAAKIGSLFHKPEQHGWSPHYSPHQQKEIHLHIHNSPNGHEHEHITDWNREGAVVPPETKTLSLDPYFAGPQTIHTPFGNYVKVASSPTIAAKR